MNSLAKEYLESQNTHESRLSEEEITSLLKHIPEWRNKPVNGVDQLERSFSFKNFSDALAFTNKIGALADEEDHHPSIVTEWGKTSVTWWTHSHHGLLRNDFIMAARTDDLYLS